MKTAAAAATPVAGRLPLQGTGSLPAGAGIGLRTPHYREVLTTRPPLAFLEVNSENFFGAGGQPLHFLERLRAHYPFSFHGVGLSLGSTDELSLRHLAGLRSLIDRFEPALVSDHVCWSSVDGAYVNDLLPLPYTEEALDTICGNVRRAQDALGRQILIENISSYVEFNASTIPEWEFVREIAARTGCALLLDVNNVYVSSVNHRFDPLTYLDAVPTDAVQEIHLAGFEQCGALLVDTHGAAVADAVWTLYEHALGRLGAVPTLIERDTNIPALAVLLEEANTAARLLGEANDNSARVAA